MEAKTFSSEKALEFFSKAKTADRKIWAARPLSYERQSNRLAYKNALNQLAEICYPLVRNMAEKMGSEMGSEKREDMIQEGMLALAESTEEAIKNGNSFNLFDCLSHSEKSLKRSIAKQRLILKNETRIEGMDEKNLAYEMSV
ncbi:MAG: hypothetical protein WCX77_00355 [Candidatus Paceibacterota bacterium]|jgi:hypothetical protein